MGENNELPTDSQHPKIQFRWCSFGSGSDRHAVWLRLTSISTREAPIRLRWSSELGRYQSDLVSLPTGIHSGSIVFAKDDQVTSPLPSCTVTDLAIYDKVLEIDSFFVTPHKFGVELFTKEHPPYSKRLSLSTHFEPNFKSTNPKRKSARRCVSFEDIPFDDRRPKTRSDNFTHINSPKKFSKWASHYCSSGLGLDSDGASTFPVLNSSFSVENKGQIYISTPSPDSQYHSRNRSLYNLSELTSSQKTSPDIDNEKSINNSIHFEEDQNRNVDFPENLENNFNIDPCYDDEQIENVTKDQKERGIDEILIHDNEIFFQEIDPTENEPYGCLITFESRSTSMNDVGSPRALEEVLVSLTSVDSVAKPIIINHENQKVSDSDGAINEFGDLEEAEERQHFNDTSHNTDSDCDSADYSVDIHEDENFECNSICIEERKIPIDIKSVMESEDSCDDTISGPIDSSKDRYRAVSASCSPCYLGTDNKTTSKEKTVDELVLVDPGSLISETDCVDNAQVSSLKNSIKKPHEIMNSKRNNDGLIKSPVILDKTRILKSVMKSSIDKISSFEISKNLKNIENSSNKKNSRSTQTYSIEICDRSPLTHINSSSSSSSPRTTKDTLNFRPLPNRLWSPWSTKPSQGYQKCPYSPNSRIKKLQKYLYNLAKADDILKAIHPFDYTPTKFHKDFPIDSPKIINNKPLINLERYTGRRSSLNTPSFRKAHSPSSNIEAGFESKNNYRRSYEYLHKENLQNSKILTPSFQNQHNPLTYIESGIDLKNNYNRSYEFSRKENLLKSQRLRPKAAGKYRSPHIASRESASHPQRSLYTMHESSSSDIEGDDHVILRACSLPDLQRRPLDTHQVTSPVWKWETSSSGFYQDKLKSNPGLEPNIKTFSKSSFRRRHSLGAPLVYHPEDSTDTDALLEEASTYFSNTPINKRRATTRRPKTSNISQGCGDNDGNWANRRPYLPYGAGELSLGQMVKVLVPGKGVAMGKVVSNPRPFRDGNIPESLSVLLLSEPHSFRGRVVSVPLEKVLLAWPKT